MNRTTDSECDRAPVTFAAVVIYRPILRSYIYIFFLLSLSCWPWLLTFFFETPTTASATTTHTRGTDASRTLSPLICHSSEAEAKTKGLIEFLRSAESNLQLLLGAELVRPAFDSLALIQANRPQKSQPLSCCRGPRKVIGFDLFCPPCRRNLPVP